jgi:hypothetical protein
MFILQVSETTIAQGGREGEYQGGKLLRLLSQICPRIRPQQSHDYICTVILHWEQRTCDFV